MIEWVNRYHRWYKLISVNPKTLLRKATNTGKDFEPSCRKINNLIEVFRRGQVDAPLVGCDPNGGVVFIDGRHRTVLAARLGFARIKVAVVPEELPFVENFLGLPEKK